MIEDTITEVVKRLLENPHAVAIIEELNPNFVAPKKPFRRMNYSDAIQYLKDHNITKEDGSFYEFGEDIPELPERKMTDQINEVSDFFIFQNNYKKFKLIDFVFINFLKARIITAFSKIFKTILRVRMC